MVKLADIPEYERNHLMSKLLPPLCDLPWVVNEKPLSEKKVAIITTAGLNFREDHNFDFIDSSYRALPGDLAALDILMTHASVNYDRSGFQEDINVVSPIDRFKELESVGVIGRLADVNYSFVVGGILPDVYEANVKDLAKLRKADGVDAAFIVLVCLNCSRTVCGIASYLESEGIQTAGIALFREFAQTMKPPRILWVSFPLGRPFGKPSDAVLQTEVMKRALGLLDAEQGPVLEAYPIDLADIDTPPPACPVSFKPKRDDELWHGRLSYEIGALAPRYELGLKRREHTTVGICESTIPDIVADVTTWADDVTQPVPEPSWLKLALEDLKSFYSEAITAQPGDHEAGFSDALIFDDTVLGQLIFHYVNYFEAKDPYHPFIRVCFS